MSMAKERKVILCTCKRAKDSVLFDRNKIQEETLMIRMANSNSPKKSSSCLIKRDLPSK